MKLNTHDRTPSPQSSNFIKDIKNAYMEIKENEILVVDYYWDVKKGKAYFFF